MHAVLLRAQPGRRLCCHTVAVTLSIIICCSQGLQPDRSLNCGLQLTLGHLQGALSLGVSLVRKELLTFFTPA
jgi:hypothetical protein